MPRKAARPHSAPPRSTLHAPRSTLHAPRLHAPRSTLYALRSTLYALRSTLYALRSTLKGGTQHECPELCTFQSHKFEGETSPSRIRMSTRRSFVTLSAA